MLTELDEQSAAVDYYSKIMTDDDVLLLKTLVSRIGKAPANAKRYLQRRCKDTRGLEEFFKDNSHKFFVENGRVALNDDELEISSENAVSYFKEKLETYERAVHFMRLKKDQLEAAPDNIASFITRFYPGKEFKHFLRSRPDVFVVYPDHTVFLIETETAAFYEMVLETCGEKKLPFLNFRGHIGQAPPHIQAYVNKYYQGDDFQLFLRKNDNVFLLDRELKVSLVPLE